MYDSEIFVYLLYNMNMIKVLFALLITAGQSILYVILNDLMIAVYTGVVHAPSYNLNWGISQEFAFYEFIILCFFMNVCIVYFIRKSHWILIFTIFIAHTIFWIDSFFYSPYRVMLLVGVSGVSFFSCFLFRFLLLRFFRNRL
jgi:hypothetical protein